MMIWRMEFVAAVGCVLVMALPRGAAAQSVIAGVVKDTSGAVLPGVTVEASSPALIEKVRTVTTDDAGSSGLWICGPGHIRSSSRWPGSVRSAAKGSN